VAAGVPPAQEPELALSPVRSLVPPVWPLVALLHSGLEPVREQGPVPPLVVPERRRCRLFWTCNRSVPDSVIGR
jgi:hypothetical protein